MSRITLTDGDRALLARLGEDDRTVEELADALGQPTDALRERLAELADNGLVAGGGDGTYERTDSGRRVLEASIDSEDVDVPPAVERALDGADLRADERDAVERAFALVRYHGAVAGGRIREEVYGEVPAGYDSADAWWEGFVRESLAALPGVEEPAPTGGEWRYEGRPGIEDADADGRRQLDGEE